MKIRNFFIFSLLIIALSLTLTGFAQSGDQGHPGGMPGRHNPMEFLVRDLNLTPEQQTKVKSIFDAQRESVRTIMEASFSNHQKLQNLIKSGNFDLTQVRAIAQAQVDNQTLMIIEKQRMDSQIYAILSSEQQAKFDQRQKGFEGNRPAPPGEDRLVEILSRRLNLTTEQKTQIESILARQKEAVEPLAEKLSEFHKQLALISINGQFNEIAIKSLAQQYSLAMIDLNVAHETTKFNIYSVLTNDQKEDFLRFPPFPGRPGTPGMFPGRPPR